MQFYLITVALVLLLDRLTKYLVVKNMELTSTVPVIEGFFHLTYIKNAGAAFGLLANMRWVFVVVTAFILLAVLYMVFKTPTEDILIKVTLGMITGGALGNLIDRISTGLVIDFLDFRGIWPYIFNVADSFVIVGVVLLTWQVFKSDRIM